MINAFIKYKKLGLACLPTGPEKLPFIPKDETWLMGWNNKAEYEKSFGIGIVCGQPSGGLECIDFDNHFGDAKQVISDFMQIEEVKEVLLKHSIPIQATTSGGYHLIYRCSVIAGNQKLASRPKYDPSKKQKKDVLIETRGEGGYFCAEPTPGYRIIKNSIEKIPNISPEEREIIITACKSFNTYAEARPLPEENNDLPGNRYNNSPEAEYDIKQALLGAGWREVNSGQWLRPGKKKGISATLGKVAPGIFYNFSSSADPFDENKAYTAFQVVGILKYNKDFRTFARELAERQKQDKLIEDLVKPSTEKKEEPNTVNQLDEIIRKAHIDTTIPVNKPPIIMRIKTRVGADLQFTRVFTLGNFSTIIGKSKAKKSYLATLFMAAAARNSEVDYTIQANLPEGRPGVVLFDTEQSNYDAYIAAKRVADMAGKNAPRFGAFDLREFTPHQRCSIIDRFIEQRTQGVSLIVIDGIADLATAINSEDEASRVVSLLMKWTKLQNIHIIAVIHQNKNDTFATGHLGSTLMKKSECVISVTKDEDNNLNSEVNCDYIRGAIEFDKFVVSINPETGMPSIEQAFTALQKDNEEPPFYDN